jgi:hypothetical protein
MDDRSGEYGQALLSSGMNGTCSKNVRQDKYSSASYGTQHRSTNMGAADAQHTQLAPHKVTNNIVYQHLFSQLWATSATPRDGDGDGADSCSADTVQDGRVQPGTQVSYIN